jgi:hypothetical protein
MTTQLREAIARLRKRAWRVVSDDDVKLVCDALEANMAVIAMLDREQALKPRFDKVAYQREYMRKWRKTKS